jgi:dTDP-4-amino-4,6-dideoxygalactose transaminase
VDFYQVGRDCQPDFSDIEARICGETQAIMAVHYFGFPQKIREFRELCDRSGLALIEDCAHVLRTEVDGQRLGTFGDTSVYSWRKFFPIYDGGELVLNRSTLDFKMDWTHESWLLTLKVARNMFDQFCGQPRHPVLRTLSGWVQYGQELWSTALVADYASIRSVHNNSASFIESMLNQPISRLSRWTLAHSDVPAVIEKRRRNYLYLQRELGRLDGVSLPFPELPTGVCPWIFPLLFDEITNAHLALRQRGVPAVTWQGVRQPGICKTAYPDADFLYDSLVFLPVHQNLPEGALRAVVEAVKAVRRTNR